MMYMRILTYRVTERRGEKQMNLVASFPDLLGALDFTERTAPRYEDETFEILDIENMGEGDMTAIARDLRRKAVAA